MILAGLLTLPVFVVAMLLSSAGASPSRPSERALRDEVEWLSAELGREKLKGPYEEERIDVVAALTVHNQNLAERVRLLLVRCEALRTQERDRLAHAEVARGELRAARAEIARRQARRGLND